MALRVRGNVQPHPPRAPIVEAVAPGQIDDRVALSEVPGRDRRSRRKTLTIDRVRAVNELAVTATGHRCRQRSRQTSRAGCRVVAHRHRQRLFGGADLDRRPHHPGRTAVVRGASECGIAGIDQRAVPSRHPPEWTVAFTEHRTQCDSQSIVRVVCMDQIAFVRVGEIPALGSNPVRRVLTSRRVIGSEHGCPKIIYTLSGDEVPCDDTMRQPTRPHVESIDHDSGRDRRGGQGNVALDGAVGQLGVGYGCPEVCDRDCSLWKRIPSDDCVLHSKIGEAGDNGGVTHFRGKTPDE